MSQSKRLLFSGLLTVVMLAGVVCYLYLANRNDVWFEDRIGGPSESAESENLSPEKVKVRVMAHYMPWFERKVKPSGDTNWQHWQWSGENVQHDPNVVLENGQHDIATVHYPLIGPYHSLDPAVIEYHILTAKLIGIEAFMCNWYGPGDYTDQVVAAMLPIAERLDFKIGICMEEKAFFPPYSTATNREELVQEMARHLNHIVNSYADSAAFLKHHTDQHATGVEVPLMFLFNFYDEGSLGSNLLTAEEILAARNEVDRGLLLIRNDLNPSMFPGSDGVYVWCAKKSIRDELYKKVNWMLESAPSLIYRSAVASPGFDDSGVNGWGGGPRITPRRGTDEYCDNWKEAIASGFDSIQVVTWNDFQEGTNIEPTVEYQFKFVDETEQQIEKVSGRLSETGDNDLGYEVYQLRISIREVGNEQQRARFSGELDLIVKSLIEEPEASSRNRIQKLERLLENRSR